MARVRLTAAAAAAAVLALVAALALLLVQEDRLMRPGPGAPRVGPPRHAVVPACVDTRATCG